MIEKNLNNNTNGSEIYIGYIKTNDKNEAITGIGERWFNATNRNPVSYVGNYHKYQYTRITDFNGNHINTNEGAGSNSKFVYLYQTKDTNAGSAVTDIDVILSKNVMSISQLKENDTYNVVLNSNDNSLANFNRGTNGDYIYIKYKK